MCGRLDQNDIGRLLDNFDWVKEVINRSGAQGRFNVPPGTVRPVMHVTDEGLVVDDLFWGYLSPWGEATGKVKIASNATFEKINQSYWKPLLKRGRVIVPAAGWYEWTGEKPHKQPWHIHRADSKPLYMAAVANFESKGDYKGATGFALVTSMATGGLLAMLISLGNVHVLLRLIRDVPPALTVASRRPARKPQREKYAPPRCNDLHLKRAGPAFQAILGQE